jgi:acetyl esterase/lipase
LLALDRFGIKPLGGPIIPPSIITLSKTALRRTRNPMNSEAALCNPARSLQFGLFSLLLAVATATGLAQSSPALLPQQAQNTAPQSRENLLDLSIGDSELHPLPATSGGITETADFTRELYQMQWRDNDPIDVYVILPKGVKRPPVILYLYGYPADANRFRNDAFCKIATRGGVAAIGFMPALTGQRYHDVPMRTWFVSELHDSLVKSVHDVQMIANYVVSRDDLDGKRLGIFGQGAGATIAGLAATVDPRFEAIDLLDPWGDWPAWMAESRLIPDQERAELLGPTHLAALAPLDPIHWLPTLAGRSLKIDDAFFDSGTPAKAKERIESAVPASAKIVHYATHADFEKNAIADGQLVMWIQQQLLNRSNGQSNEVAPAQADGWRDSKTSIQASGLH